MAGVDVRRILTCGLFAGLWLYVNLRPRYGAGARASALAGFSWWLIASISSWQWSDLGLIRQRDLVNLMALSLPLLIAVTVIAAWSYERAERHTVARGRESLQ